MPMLSKSWCLLVTPFATQLWALSTSVVDVASRTPCSSYRWTETGILELRSDGKSDEYDNPLVGSAVSDDQWKQMGHLVDWASERKLVECATSLEFVIKYDKLPVNVAVARSSALVGTLKKDAIVEVLEFSEVDGRTRGRIASPNGWISIKGGSTVFALPVPTEATHNMGIEGAVMSVEHIDPSDASLKMVEPIIIPLRRDAVPLRRQGKIVTYKTSYSGVIRVGVPAQEFRVVFDTGSGHVIVPAAGCRSKSCLNHRTYNLSESLTAEAINMEGQALTPWDDVEQLTIGFGTGVIKGQFARDSVCLGPSTGPGRILRDCQEAQLIMAVEMSDNPFRAFPFDGIVGLGLQMLSLTDEFNFLHLMSHNRRVTASQFGVFLTEGEHGEESELAFGGFNANRTLTPLSWSPVISADEGHWQIKINAVRVDGELLDICQDGSCKGVIDTGSSHIGVPVKQKAVLEEMLKRDADDFLDCRLVDSAILEFELESTSLTLSPATYMRRIPLREGVDVGNAVVSDNLTVAAGQTIRNATAVDINATNVTRHCSPRLMAVDMPAPLGPNMWILGEPFSLKYYTVYDWATLKVGFGLANNRRNTMPPETGKGSLPEDLAAEGHLLFQKATRSALTKNKLVTVQVSFTRTCVA